MSKELAIELHQSGRAHAFSACLLYRASVEHAQDHGEADPVLHALNGPNSLSIHYLLGLGMELLLKASIVALDGSVDAKFLQDKVRHDLTTALEEARARGFDSQAPHLAELLDLLREPYKSHWFRYQKPEQFPLPGDFDQVVAALEVLDQEVAALVG